MRLPEPNWRNQRAPRLTFDNLLGKAAMVVAILYLVGGALYFGVLLYLLNDSWAGLQEARGAPNLPQELIGSPFLILVLLAIPEIVAAWAILKGYRWGLWLAVPAFALGGLLFFLLGLGKYLIALAALGRLTGFIRPPTSAAGIQGYLPQERSSTRRR